MLSVKARAPSRSSGNHPPDQPRLPQSIENSKRGSPVDCTCTGWHVVSHSQVMRNISTVGNRQCLLLMPRMPQERRTSTPRHRPNQPNPNLQGYTVDLTMPMQQQRKNMLRNRAMHADLTVTPPPAEPCPDAPHRPWHAAHTPPHQQHRFQFPTDHHAHPTPPTTPSPLSSPDDPPSQQQPCSPTTPPSPP